MGEMLIRAAGGVVYTRSPAGELLLLLISDRYGSWTLPKGHLEAGEAAEEAALREIEEETGLRCQLERLIATVQYPVYKRGRWRDKQVHYYLARAAYIEPTPAIDEGITEARWVRPAEAAAAMSYAQVRDVVRQGIAILEGAS